MSNKIPPAIPPKETPTTPSTAGELRSRSISPGAEGSTVSRQAKAQKIVQQPTPITDRSISQDVPDLAEDSLNRLAQFLDLKTYAAMRKASKRTGQELDKTAQRTVDLKELQKFSEAHQWGRREEVAFFFLRNWIDQTGSMPTIEELKQASNLDINLNLEEITPEQLNEIDQKYKAVQKVYNDLIASAAIFAPSAEFFFASSTLGFWVTTFCIGLPLALYTGTEIGVELMLGVTATAILSIAASAGKVALSSSFASEMALFKTTAAGIMNATTRKLGLNPE